MPGQHGVAPQNARIVPLKIRMWTHLSVGEDSAVIALHDPLYEVVARFFIERLLLSSLVVHGIKCEVLGLLVCPRRVAK